jgi:hypothetical protein
VPAGFQIDLARILADRIGVRLNIDWIALRGAARGVNCDAIMGSLARAQDDETEEHKPSTGVLRAAMTRPYARLATRPVTLHDDRLDGAKLNGITASIDGKLIYVTFTRPQPHHGGVLALPAF